MLRVFPSSLFAAGHGSQRRGIANPIGQIWSGAMMLDHLGHPDAARAIVTAIEHVLEEPSLHTPDMGGKATTKELGAAIEQAIG